MTVIKPSVHLAAAICSLFSAWQDLCFHKSTDSSANHAMLTYSTGSMTQCISARMSASSLALQGMQGKYNKAIKTQIVSLSVQILQLSLRVILYYLALDLVLFQSFFQEKKTWSERLPAEVAPFRLIQTTQNDWFSCKKSSSTCSCSKGRRSTLKSNSF